MIVMSKLIFLRDFFYLKNRKKKTRSRRTKKPAEEPKVRICQKNLREKSAKNKNGMKRIDVNIFFFQAKVYSKDGLITALQKRKNFSFSKTVQDCVVECMSFFIFMCIFWAFRWIQKRFILFS